MESLLFFGSLGTAQEESLDGGAECPRLSLSVVLPALRARCSGAEAGSLHPGVRVPPSKKKSFVNRMPQIVQRLQTVFFSDTWNAFGRQNVWLLMSFLYFFELILPADSDSGHDD